MLPLPGRTPALAEGTRVLAEWEDTGHWFPGTLTSVENGVYSVAFDDETSEDRSAAQVERLAWRVGTKVTCMDGMGEIAAWQPEARTLTLATEDGRTVDTNTGFCLEDRSL